jgi:Cd2+/Zn2+-exporting ATPase
MDLGFRTLLKRPAGIDARLPMSIVAGVLLAVGFGLSSLFEGGVAGHIGHAIAWVALLLGFVHGGQAAIASLRELRPNIDLLMVVGAGLGAAIGHPEEGAFLLFLFNLSGALEHRALAKAKEAVSRLHQLMPKNALVRRGQEWVETDPESLAPGDVALVRPGEIVPADGAVVAGRSTVNQSTLTGESLPRSVEPGDAVFAGTLNEHGAIEIEVTRRVTESSIRRILRLVLEAQERRQPVQRLIDRFSTPYTIAVFIAAGLTLAGFWALSAEHSFFDATYKAITLLVVASPCALVISTPTVTLCGLSRAARAGVLVKGGDALERLARVRHVALDKTGTLTTGRIEVTHVEPIGAADVDSLLSIALAAEERSTHPIAAAIVRLAESRQAHPAELASLSNVPGRGIEGTYQGETVRIGTYTFCEPVIPVCFRRHTEEIVDRIRGGGGIPVVIAHDTHTLVLALADTPREGAEELTRELREVGVQTVTMLTGDTRVVAEKVARQLGITDVHAELLPEQKVEEIRRLRAAEGDGRGGLAVIGDGVNDAPALAVADVGLAMGGIGADAALETADVVLLHDDLNRIPWSIALARRVRRVMMANLTFAAAVVVVLAAATLFMEIPLSLGVLGHEGSTLLVVANSLRILAHPRP